MKKLLFLTLLISGGAWADCETTNKTPSGIASCYEKESYAKVILHLNQLKELSKE